MRKPLGKRFYRGQQAMPFREAVQIDNVVYLSGQLAFGEDGRLVGSDVASQTRQTFVNIERVLSGCGLTLDDVFKVTAWITTADDFTDFNQAFAEALGDNLPVRSTVICQLAAPGALVELEVAAHAGSDHGS